MWPGVLSRLSLHQRQQTYCLQSQLQDTGMLTVQVNPDDILLDTTDDGNPRVLGTGTYGKARLLTGHHSRLSRTG